MDMGMMGEMVNTAKTVIMASIKKFFNGMTFGPFEADEAIAAFITLMVMAVIAAKAPWYITVIVIVLFSLLVGWLEDD